MKRLFFIFLLVSLLPARTGFAKDAPKQKIIFSNSIMPGSYFYSQVTYLGPAWVRNVKGKLPVSEKSFTPGNSLMLHYASRKDGNWQVKIHHHRIRGIDNFKNATHLVFRVLVETETAPDALPFIAIGEKDKVPSSSIPIQKYLAGSPRGQWGKVSIPLIDFGGSNSTESINQITLTNQGVDDKEHTLLIDQIELESDEDLKPAGQVPVLESAKGYEKHVDITWKTIADPAVKYIKIYRSRDNARFFPVGVQIPQINRFADYTDTVGGKFFYKITLLDNAYRESTLSNGLMAETRAMNDEELVEMVQEANFRYYWEGAEKHSGLALENIPGRQDMIASGASGFGIMALLAGTDRKFISRRQSIDRFLKIVNFLEKIEKFHGAFSHFIDGPTGKAEPFFGARDNGGDLVETSFLLQGLLAAQQYFNQDTPDERKIREGIQSIWQGIEWSWYRRTKDNPYLLWHWSPDKEWVINHKLIGWNETMITYFLAIASPTYAIPASMYYSGWASQSDEAAKYRENWGKTSDGRNYVNGKTYFGIPLPVGVSSGGPLFFVHYSFMGLDPHRMRDVYTNYFTNNRNVAMINYRYCVENPERHVGYGDDCWGLTASDGPWRYSANEPAPHADEGKMTPTGALASFPYTPEQSMAALKNYYRNMGHFLWGEYGFRDAFNLDENWCSEIYMGLNQAPIAVMIENYRSGLLWKLFMEHPDVQRAKRKIDSEMVRQNK